MEFTTPFDGRENQSALVSEVGQQWEKIKSTEKHPTFDFLVRFVNISKDAVYGFHITTNDAKDSTYINIDREITHSKTDANIVLHSDVEPYTLFVDYLFLSNSDHHRLKYDDNWFGYMPRAMLLIRWIAVNLGYTKLVLTDDWDFFVRTGMQEDVLSDTSSDEYGVGVFDNSYNALDSENYVELFKGLQRGDNRELKKYNPIVIDKVERDYKQAVKDGLVETIIENGYYGRFNFKRHDPIIHGRLAVKVDDMKTTRTPFNFTRR